MNKLLFMFVILQCCVVGAQTDTDHDIRCLYIQEVRWIGTLCDELKNDGLPLESIAKTAHQLRRDIGEEYKKISSYEMQDVIKKRNQKKYGDPLGPSIKWLRDHGNTWQDIIDSSSKTGGSDVITSKCKCIDVLEPTPADDVHVIKDNITHKQEKSVIIEYRYTPQAYRNFLLLCNRCER